MYKPEVNNKGEIIRWNKIDEIEKDLIIIDEASMITGDIWMDLLSYDIPIIAFGDHGQLPPINDNFSLMENANLTLEKIHRQSFGNQIINLATKSRVGDKIIINNYDKKVKKIHIKSEEAEDFCQRFFEGFNEDCLILVGMNHTRIKLNKAIRNAKKIISEEPIEGDKVVCLKNIYDNKTGDIFNGMTGFISSIEPFKEHWYQVLITFPLEEKIYEGKISKHQFNSPTPIRKVKGIKAKKIGDLFDFGYALTVHKAQGSEAKKVLIFDESFVFRKRDEGQGKKWLYTAITRAQEELCILGY
jgi:exodeoxyribonuclease V